MIAERIHAATDSTVRLHITVSFALRMRVCSASPMERDTLLARPMPRYSTPSCYDYTTMPQLHLFHQARQHASCATFTASDVHALALLISQTYSRLLWTNTRDPAGAYLRAMIQSASFLQYS